MAETPMWRRYLRFLGPDPEADLDDELAFHLQMRTEVLAAKGMPAAAAREEALRRMGDLAAVRRACLAEDRGAARAHSLHEKTMNAAEDLRRAARSLRRAPAFTLVAVVTLALGIGATTAIFTLLDAVVLNPLPYPASDRLVWLDHPVSGPGAEGRWGVSQAGYFHFRDNARSLSGLGAFSTDAANLTGEGTAERVPLVNATPGLLGVLGARPAAGRLFTEADGAPDAAPVALLAHDFWTRRFGADPSVVGRTLRLDSRPVEVIGVLPPGFHPPGQKADLWLPLQFDPAAPPQNAHWLSAVGRLADGQTPERARTELARLVGRFTELFPGAYSPAFMSDYGFSVDAVPLRDHVVGPVRRVLWVLLGAVGVVLLIACANVANLFLVRGEARRRETAIRSALGAGRGALARHALAESLLVAVAAGVLGAALAAGGIRLLVAMEPAGIPRLDEVRAGGAGLAFAAVLSLFAGIVFGLLPVLRAPGGMGVLRDGGRGMTPSRRQHAVRGGLVVAQVALALVLMAAAGLMLRSFVALSRVHPGLDPRGVLTVSVALPYAKYDSYEKVAAFHRELAGRLDALPGVTGVGATNGLPLVGAGGCSLVFVRDRPIAEGEEPPCVGSFLATPGFFAALGIPVRGAAPGWDATERRAGEVVITPALARRFWPGEDPVGKALRPNGREEPYYRVAGVTGELRALGLDQPPTEAVFYPVLPLEGAPLWSPPRDMRLVVRTTLDRPAELTGAVRRAVAELDPEVPIADVMTMEAAVARSMARVSFTLLLLGIAAAMALVLSAVGIYGVVSYVVGQRRAEIGVRMALGARVAQVGRMVVLQSVRLAALGVVVGLLGAVAVTRLLGALLYGVAPTDPVTLAAVSALLVLLAAAASYAPARRAARVDPAEVLRTD
jgi:putative ABC transport system permease protein